MTIHSPHISIARHDAAPEGAESPRGWPVLRLGFRPFYLGAALFAMLAVPLWLAMLLGAVNLNLHVSPLLWHAHEMLFGFAATVIAGFLLTAAKSWTGLPTPRGGVLGALAALWLSARLAAVVAPYALYAALDLIFLPLVAALLIRVLLRAGNRRNLALGAILMLLALANLCFHLAALGLIDIAAVRALHGGLALIVMVECVIGGRVIPAFTAAVLHGVKPRAPSWLDPVTLVTTAVALASWVLMSPNAISAVALGAAGVLHAVRLWHWRSWRARARPILWVLHLAYAWIPIGLLLLAWAQWGGVSVSAGVHALAVGATGGLVIGMITRTARGHTGRPIHASKLEVTAYLLVSGAAVARVLLPLVAPQQLTLWLSAAAAAWAVAFGIYVFVFAPWLVSPRLDGQDG